MRYQFIQFASTIKGWKIAMSYDVFLDNKLLGIGFGAPTPTEYAIPYEIIKVGISEEVKITYDPIFGCYLLP